VFILGLMDHTRPVLAAADAFLNLSSVEGMSNAVAEAMSVGLPVVATDAGGTAELIRDGVQGSIVPRGDVVQVAQRLIDLASSSDLRFRLGGAARERIRGGFSVESMVDRYARLYEELLSS
jgi:glycosyltransferase involved in cell wall biosynthesis